MIKRALLVVGFLALCFPVAAQQNNRADEFDAAAALALYRPEIFTSVDSSLLVRDLPILTFFLDGRLPGSTALGRMGTAPVANLPVALVSAAPAQKTNASSVSGKDGKDSSAEVMTSPLNPVYYGGEVGVLCGHVIGNLGGAGCGTQHAG